MDLKHAPKTLLVAAVGWSFVITAFAQWQWVDKDGRKVFSDRSPPAEILEKDIRKRPTPSAVSARPAPSVAVSAGGNRAIVTVPANAAAASAPKLSGKDAELEARKKQADDQETAKKKADEEKAAKVRADNCERAKNGMATLQSGVRMASVNASGEREVFDDAKRAAETRRTEDIIAANCK